MTKLWLLWLSVLLGVLLLSRYFLRVLKKRREKLDAQKLEEARTALKQYHGALRQGNYPDAYALLAENLIDRVNYKEFVKQKRALAENLGGLRTTQEERAEIGIDKDGWWSRIQERWHYERDDSELVFYLVHDGTAWKIAAIT